MFINGINSLDWYIVDSPSTVYGQVLNSWFEMRGPYLCGQIVQIVLVLFVLCGIAPSRFFLIISIINVTNTFWGIRLGNMTIEAQIETFPSPLVEPAKA